MSSSRVYADEKDINQKKIFLENFNQKLQKEESELTKNNILLKSNNKSSKSSKKDSQLVNDKKISINLLKGNFSKESTIINEKKQYVKFEYSLSEDDNSISSENKNTNINEKKNSTEKNIFPLKKKKTTLSDIRKKNIIDSRENSMNKENYLDFNLVKNCFADLKCSSPIHKYLPYCYKNDEKYKMKLFKFIKDGKFENSRSLGGKYFCYLNNELKFNKNIIKKDSFINDNDYFINRKIKKIYSSKKFYTSEKIFYKTKIVNGETINDNNNKIKFEIFFDRDIGFIKKWQKNLKETDMDDDVESDNETLVYAYNKVYEDIEEGIENFTRNRFKLRNVKYLKSC